MSRSPIKAHAGVASVGAKGRTLRSTDVKTSAANSAFNAAARRNGSAARKLTPGQAAALQARGSRTY